MNPTALLLNAGTELVLQGDPKAERPVTGGQLGRVAQAMTFKLPQQIAPGVFTFPESVHHGQ